MTTGTPDAEKIAATVLAAIDSASPLASISDSTPDFDLDHAYQVAAALTRLRTGRGEQPIGWKIGFTNRTIWDEYGVYAPIWGPIYDTTLAHVAPSSGSHDCPVSIFAEPRIEPEIALRLADTPQPDMDERELMACIDAVAHGVEIVQSVFPDWRFTAADTVAAGAVHGCYRCGPLVPVQPAERAQWATMLASFEIALFQGEREIDRGVAENVLGGPLEALRHFVRGHADYSAGAALQPGQIVTTGTVTRAFPVQAGERWRTELRGLPLRGLDLTLT